MQFKLKDIHEQYEERKRGTEVPKKMFPYRVTFRIGMTVCVLPVFYRDWRKVGVTLR